jgi:hypothetical protein
MECFHGKSAACSTTARGTFWFSGETPSCEFFCHDEDCYLFTRSMEACQNSGSNHPICPTHQRLAKLRVIKDKMKDNYGRPFFTCSDRHDPCNFWQWGDIYESPRPCCKHGMVCTVRKVKKEGPTQNHLFFCCPQIDSCGFFDCLVWPRLASSYSVIRYKIDTRMKTREKHSLVLTLMLRKRMKNFLRNMNNCNKTK